MTTSLRRIAPTFVLTAVAGAAVVGCDAAGLVADKLAGPADVPAQYVPGEMTQVLVIAENYRVPTPSSADADRLARMVGDQLSARKAAQVISPEKLMLVRDAAAGRPGAYGKMSVVDLGKAVGAQQVLYIDMGGVGVGAAPGSDMLKGVASANVRVIDVAAGTVVWPTDASEGAAVGFESPLRRSTQAVTSETVRGEALAGLSGNIARLFHKYKPSDMEALLDGR